MFALFVTSSVGMLRPFRSIDRLSYGSTSGPREATSKDARRLPSVEAEIALGGDLSPERKTTTMIYGSDDIATDLRKLGVAPGDGLFVHSSLSKIGHVIGGPRGLIEALIKAVGPNGLIGMPGFSKDTYDPVDLLGLDVTPEKHERIREQVLGFDPRLSDVRANGAVPEAFRSWPGVIRSPHPTSSVLLLGPDADTLAAHHDPHGWATGPETPWGRLRKRNAMKILLIGIGWNRCSALHAAESIAEHKRTVIRRFKAGRGPEAKWIEAPDVADDLDTLFPLVGAAWEKTGGVRFGTVGKAQCKLTDYGSLLAYASEWISQRNKGDSKSGAQR